MIDKSHLMDGFGRRFPYLRLSITDVCNFQCSYCSNGYENSDEKLLSDQNEIIRMLRAFIALGVWKVRVTGGEPTVRPDFIKIVQSIRDIPEIKKIALTTNGYKLSERAQSYFDAGISSINISIDSLRSDQFKLITGHDSLHNILEGMEKCIKIGFSSVKINTVLLKGMNDQDLDGFIEFVVDKPISLRFIELMRTGENQNYFEKHHLSSSFVMECLLSRGWKIKPRSDGAGPAIEFEHTDSLGSIGIIAPYSKDFCKTCNRLRVSAKGSLHLCLFGEAGYSLRHLLRSDDQQEELQNTIMDLMNHKKSTHFLHLNQTGATPHLASIGG